MPTYARNSAPFTFVHSHAVAQKLSGRIFVVSARGRCRKRPARRLIALRAPAAVRRTDVMVNRSDWLVHPEISVLSAGMTFVCLFCCRYPKLQPVQF